MRWRAVRPAVLFFLQFAVLGCVGRFTSLLFRSFGLSDGEVGWIFAAGMITGLVSVPACGVAADLHPHGKPLVILIGNVLRTATWLVLGLCSVSQQPSFATTLLVYVLGSLVGSPTVPVLDAYTIEYLVADGELQSADPAHRKALYGRERLWGAVGWGLISIILGLLLDTSFGFHSMYLLVTLTTVAMVVIMLQCTPSSPTTSSSTPPDTESPSPPPCLVSSGDAIPVDGDDLLFEGVAVEGHEGDGTPPEGDVGNRVEGDATLLEGDVQGADIPEGSVLDFLKLVSTSCRTVTFLYAVMVMGLATSLVENLVFLFFQKDLAASYTLCGVTVVITVIFEIPLFHVSTRLAKLGRDRLMVMAMLCYITRVFVYTILTDSTAWLVLLVEPLHGVTYSMLQLATVLEMSDLAPKHLQATAQGTLNFFRKVGALVGTLGGAQLMQTMGSGVAYRTAIGLVISAMVLYASTHCLSKPPYSHMPDDTEGEEMECESS